MDKSTKRRYSVDLDRLYVRLKNDSRFELTYIYNDNSVPNKQRIVLSCERGSPFFHNELVFAEIYANGFIKLRGATANIFEEHQIASECDEVPPFITYEFVSGVIIDMCSQSIKELRSFADDIEACMKNSIMERQHK